MSKQRTKPIPPFIAMYRTPRVSDTDTFGRVLVWDGVGYQPRAVELMDDRDIWVPMPRRPTKALLTRAAKTEKLAS